MKVMRKVYVLEDLDCANCAAKMESGIKAVPGVHDASVSFITQKLTMEMDDDRVAEIEKAAQKIIRKTDPDVTMII